jgi:hypothetical protein
MKFQITNRTVIRTQTAVRVGCLASLVALAPIVAEQCAAAQTAHEHATPAKLVQLVRESTRQFINVNAATAAGYGPFLGCVSGPDHGAMGTTSTLVSMQTEKSM